MSICQFPCTSVMVESTGDVLLLTTCKPQPQHSTFLAAGELSSLPLIYCRVKPPCPQTAKVQLAEKTASVTRKKRYPRLCDY